MSLEEKQGISLLLEVMKRLRDPETGCPWDIRQTFHSIVPYTIEEAYEVADCIAREDWDELQGELGDLLLQVVYYGQMSDEAGRYDFDQIAQTCADKMILRHPHIFGDAEYGDHDLQIEFWEKAKAAERAKSAEIRGLKPSALDNVPLALPALTRANKLQKRAARQQFDWEDIDGVWDKLDEELEEIKKAVEVQDGVQEELGDALFTLVNLARKLNIDPEEALRDANRKFEKRFRWMEEHSERSISKLDSSEREGLWKMAKHQPD